MPANKDSKRESVPRAQWYLMDKEDLVKIWAKSIRDQDNFETFHKKVKAHFDKKQVPKVQPLSAEKLRSRCYAFNSTIHDEGEGDTRKRLPVPSSGKSGSSRVPFLGEGGLLAKLGALDLLVDTPVRAKSKKE